jgi:hypothetical protein
VHDPVLAESLAGAWARLGEDEHALGAVPMVRGTRDVLALIQIASAGPRGHADAGPERAWAELSSWTPSAAPGTPRALVSLWLASMVRVQVRYGAVDSVLARIATIEDPAWRARALLSAAGELAATPRRDLAERALHDAEALLDTEPADGAVMAADAMRSIARPWLPYAYVRMGDARAGPALAAVVDLAKRIDSRVQQLLLYAAIVIAINATRLHIAEARAGAAAPAAPLGVGR